MLFKQWKGLRHVGLWRLFCTSTLIWAVGCEDGQGDKTVSEGDTNISAPDVRSVADAAAADTGEAPDARLPGVDVDESDAKEVGEDIGEDAAGPLEPTACNDGVDSDGEDRKSTRLNSSHVRISYAVFCLKKKTNKSTRK